MCTLHKMRYVFIIVIIIMAVGLSFGIVWPDTELECFGVIHPVLYKHK